MFDPKKVWCDSCGRYTEAHKTCFEPHNFLAVLTGEFTPQQLLEALEADLLKQDPYLFSTKVSICVDGGTYWFNFEEPDIIKKERRRVEQRRKLQEQQVQILRSLEEVEDKLRALEAPSSEEEDPDDEDLDLESTDED